ncbi:MAG TPA: hypothetical protein PKG49_09685 [Nitrosomonas mobilis]|nr:hypothetical protein [Nitrosomonas mobilis]
MAEQDVARKEEGGQLSDKTWLQSEHANQLNSPGFNVTVDSS